MARASPGGETLSIEIYSFVSLESPVLCNLRGILNKYLSHKAYEM